MVIAFILAGLILPNEENQLTTPSPDVNNQKDAKEKDFIAPTGEKITASGKIMDNFFKKSIVNKRGDALITNTKDYQITYFSKEDQFLISILSSPFETNRKQAERQFLTDLNIDEKSACNINVIINTPNYANPNEAGTNYTLSFCKK